MSHVFMQIAEKKLAVKWREKKVSTFSTEFPTAIFHQDFNLSKKKSKKNPSFFILFRIFFHCFHRVFHNRRKRKQPKRESLQCPINRTKTGRERLCKNPVKRGVFIRSFPFAGRQRTGFVYFAVIVCFLFSDIIKTILYFAVFNNETAAFLAGICFFPVKAVKTQSLR